MKAARRAWFEAQPDLDPDRLVFLDETAATTTMARRHGRAPLGERCRLSVPLERRRTKIVTAALRTTGLLATALFEGETNGGRFRDYVARTLLPALRPGDTVVLDNLPVTRSMACAKPLGPRARLLFPAALQP